MILNSHRFIVWLKALLCVTLLVAVAGAVILLFLHESSLYESEHDYTTEESLSAEEALSFLDSAGLKIDLPAISVKHHTYSYYGADQSREVWDLVFDEPISEILLTGLDSLCSADCLWKKTSPDTYNYTLRKDVSGLVITKSIIIDSETNKAHMVLNVF